MGYEKLAKDIYKLALEVEAGVNESAGSAGFEANLRRNNVAKASPEKLATTRKTADRMVQFTDGAGNTFILPYEQVGTSTWAYSPYDRSRSKKTGIFNVQMTGKLEDVFATDAKVAGVKTAERMVQFKDSTGRTFALPYDQVGTARWAYSPYDRSRAQREGVMNVQLSNKLEEAFGVE